MFIYRNTSGCAEAPFGMVAEGGFFFLKKSLTRFENLKDSSQAAQHPLIK